MTSAAHNLVRLAPDAGWRTDPRDGYAIHVDTQPRGASRLFAESIARGLDADPKWLRCKWLYDEVGSALYEKITEQPEYYLTRTEDRILLANATAIRELVGDATIVELGSGSSSKTRRLLDSWVAVGSSRYVPLDISRVALESACADLAAAYPGLHLEGVAASYSRGLPLVRSVGPLMLVFLGSTLGNFNDEELDGFLTLVSTSLAPGDHFLLGVDLVKDPAVLEAAYNDAARWTAKFTTNVWARMNRELGTKIPVESVEHFASYDAKQERIEIYHRFTIPVDITLPGVDRVFHVAAGETIFVEISRKFHVDDVAEKAAGFGFRSREVFVDPRGWFAVLLMERSEGSVETGTV